MTEIASSDAHPFAVATLSVLRAGKKLVATLTIRNVSEGRTLELVNYGVPSGGKLGAPQFAVRGRRGAADFKGPLIKRRAPTAADYVNVPPGKGMRWEVDLTEYYDVPLGGPVRIEYDFYHPTLEGELYSIRSNAVDVP
jgi:hypothetical protein